MMLSAISGVTPSRAMRSAVDAVLMSRHGEVTAWSNRSMVASVTSRIIRCANFARATTSLDEVHYCFTPRGSVGTQNIELSQGRALDCQEPDPWNRLYGFALEIACRIFLKCPFKGCLTP